MPCGYLWCYAMQSRLRRRLLCAILGYIQAANAMRDFLISAAIIFDYIPYSLPFRIIVS